MVDLSKPLCAACFLTAVLVAGCGPAPGDGDQADFVRGELITFTGQPTSPNGAWCWFQDERAIVDPEGPTLLFTAVSASEQDALEAGDLDLHHYGLETGSHGVVELHDRLEQDDHNVAALFQLESGETLATYARHGTDRLVQTTRSRPQDPTQWSAPTVYTEEAAVTYSNLLTAGVGASQRLYNFSRSRGWNPNFLIFDPAADAWAYGGRLLAGEGRPYVKYKNSRDGSLIHVVATDQHPRDLDNSLYHGVFDGDALTNSSGEVLDSNLNDQEAVGASALTRIFRGDPDNVAWVADVEVDDQDRPVVAFSVQKDGRELPPRQGGLDHRYHLGRYLDGEWTDHEVAFAGSRLYAGEDDYTGLIAIDPNDANHLVISTDADPVTGAPLISAADSLRHYELFEGRSSDGGQSFAWTPLTSNSSVDNIRPIIPDWDSNRRVVLWMRGTYRSYTDWNTQIVGLIQERANPDTEVGSTQSWKTPTGWEEEDPELWLLTDGVLRLQRNEPHPGDIRRPGAIATAAHTKELASFQFEADVRSTQDTTVVGRDVIVVFGYQSPRRFYYAHLSKDNTVMPHNGIFLVDNADRRRIDDQGLANPPDARLTDLEWHKVKVERDTASGSIRVFMDDFSEPLMTARDTTLRYGAIGFGSSDDTGEVRAFRWRVSP